MPDASNTLNLSFSPARSADSPNTEHTGFDQDFFADYCLYFLETCLDQIQFMDRILSLKRIDARLDGYMRDRDKDRGTQNPLDPRAGKLQEALFLEGENKRGEARCVMGMEEKPERQARRIVSQLASEGLIQSDSHRAPLRIAFPTHVLRVYFPDLFDPSVLGEPKQLETQSANTKPYHQKTFSFFYMLIFETTKSIANFFPRDRTDFVYHDLGGDP